MIPCILCCIIVHTCYNAIGNGTISRINRKKYPMYIYMPGPCPVTREPSDQLRQYRLIPEGYYDNNEIVDLLRKYKTDPDTIQYIADMLEE